MSISSCSPSPHMNLANHNSLEIDTGALLQITILWLTDFISISKVNARKKKCLSPCRIPWVNIFEKDISDQDTEEAWLMFTWVRRLSNQVVSILLLILPKDLIHGEIEVFYQSGSSFNFDQFLYSIGVKHLKGKKRILQSIWQERIICVSPLKRQMAHLPPPALLLRQWSLLVGGSETV